MYSRKNSVCISDFKTQISVIAIHSRTMCDSTFVDEGLLKGNFKNMQCLGHYYKYLLLNWKSTNIIVSGIPNKDATNYTF